jgi:hypothetical protein
MNNEIPPQNCFLPSEISQLRKQIIKDNLFESLIKDLINIVSDYDHIILTHNTIFSYLHCSNNTYDVYIENIRYENNRYEFYNHFLGYSVKKKWVEFYPDNQKLIFSQPPHYRSTFKMCQCSICLKFYKDPTFARHKFV